MRGNGGGEAAPTAQKPSANANSRAGTPYSEKMREFAKSLYSYSVYRAAIIFLAGGALMAFFRVASPAEAAVSLALASIFTVVIDSAVFYALKKELKFSQNSLITGLILGTVLPPGTQVFHLLILGAAAVAAKYFIRHGGIPVLNPAAFAIVLGGLLFGIYGGWWAANEKVFLVVAAIILVWKLNKWIMEIAFLAVWALAHWGRDFIFGGAVSQLPHSLAHPVFLVPAFFMAFMLLEPKTSPAEAGRQAIYGALVALLATATFSLPLPADNLALSLLAGNVVKKIMDLAKI